MNEKIDIFRTGFVGKRHLKKGIPCQDANNSVSTRHGYKVIAVADGVSSSEFSEVASKKAVNAVCDFWSRTDTIYTDTDSMNTLMRASFNYALRMTKSEDPEHAVPYGYETTLQEAVYIPGEKYCFMYVGDGGIYAQYYDGTIKQISDVMRTEDNCVIVLSNGPKEWKYKEISDVNIESVIMVSDGVNDAIREKGIQTLQLIVSACEKNSFEDAIRKIMRKEPFDSIDDDISVCVIKTEIPKDSIKQTEVSTEKKRENRKNSVSKKQISNVDIAIIILSLILLISAVFVALTVAFKQKTILEDGEIVQEYTMETDEEELLAQDVMIVEETDDSDTTQDVLSGIVIDENDTIKYDNKENTAGEEKEN